MAGYQDGFRSYEYLEMCLVAQSFSLITLSLSLFCNSTWLLDDREMVVPSAFIVTLPFCNAYGKSFI